MEVCVNVCICAVCTPPEILRNPFLIGLFIDLSVGQCEHTIIPLSHATNQGVLSKQVLSILAATVMPLSIATNCGVLSKHVL